MNKVLYYYYGFQIDKVVSKNDYYKVSDKGIDYYVFLYDDSIDDLKKLYDINIQMTSENIDIMTIVPNIYGLYFVYDRQKYVVVKSFCKNEEIEKNIYKEVRIFDIISKWSKQANIIFKKKSYLQFSKNEWSVLWAKKIDEVEKSIDFSEKKKFVDFEFAMYFIGLAENAVSYMNDIVLSNNYNKLELSYTHKKIDFHDFFVSFFNPLNISIDFRIRDVSHFFQHVITINHNDFVNLVVDIDLSLFSEIEIRLMVARILFPSSFLNFYLNTENVNFRCEVPNSAIKNFECNFKYLIMNVENFKFFPSNYWMLYGS